MVWCLQASLLRRVCVCVLCPAVFAEITQVVCLRFPDRGIPTGLQVQVETVESLGISIFFSCMQRWGNTYNTAVKHKFGRPTCNVGGSQPLSRYVQARGHFSPNPKLPRTSKYIFFFEARCNCWSDTIAPVDELHVWQTKR